MAKNIVATYDYQDASGSLKYQKIRYEPKDFRQRRPDGTGGVVWGLSEGDYYYKDGTSEWFPCKPNENHEIVKHFDKEPKLLYRLPDFLHAVSNKFIIFFVEGEKDVETLVDHGKTATTIGGAQDKIPSELIPLFTGARIILIPDNDATGVGEKHMDAIAKQISKKCSSLKIIKLHDVKDITDWFNTGKTDDEFNELVESAEDYNKPPVLPEPPKPKVDPSPLAAPFKMLGFNSGYYYYLPDEDMQILRLSADQHTQNALIGMAPLSYWESMFSGGKNASVDWNAARNWLCRTSKSKEIGLYDARRMRGCGTWYDDGRVVQHNGNVLIVDGKETPINDFKSHYIYSASYRIEKEIAQPLPVNDAHKLLQLSRMFLWEKPLYGTLFAGWCVVAPICGVLSWRPHVWVTGRQGCGKSWTVNNIAVPVSGPQTLTPLGNSTEAGIRGSLKANAYPVIMDEAEGEDLESKKRMQKILEFARACSSDSMGHIYKGTSGGDSVQYVPRSSFMFSSIGVNITQAADANRITILTLRKEYTASALRNFDNIEKMAAATLTPEWCASLRARTLSLVPTIIKNADTFSRAVASIYDRRTGDQYGAMFAGAYSLSYDDVISYENAQIFASNQDWTDHEQTDGESDERKCLNRILENIMQYQAPDEKTWIQKSVGEILYEGIISSNQADALERMGLKYENDVLMVSVQHVEIKKMLYGTSWENTWGRILNRIEGSKAITTRFHGVSHRCIALTKKILFEEE